MSNYVDFHKQPAPPKKELADHEVFNNALMRAQAAGEKPSAELFAKIDSEYKKKKEKKAELMPLRSPLQPAIIGALAGTIGGGMRAPKGKLLKYMLGGAAGGGAIGGAMGLGGNFGAIAGDAISRGAGMDEKGTASAATQIGGRLAGLAGGAYLGLKAHNRIGEELEHEDEPKKKEKAAMSLYSFGAKFAVAPQAVNMNANGAPQAGDMGDHLNEQINLVHKLVGQGNASYPYKPGAPFNPVQAAGVRNNPAAPPLKAPAPVLGKAGSVLASFGAKIAQVTGMTYDPDNANVKRLKARHPDNWQQIMAQSQGLSDATQAKVIKKAQSACSPCAMPNGPKNKPYTSESPAVTDASQKSEEIGKPPVTETEHSEAEAKLPEEGAKSAFAFGAKIAAGIFTPTQLQGDPISYDSSVADERANLFLGKSVPASQTNLLAGNKLMDDERIKLRNLNALRHDVESYKKPTFASVTGDALKNWGRNIYNAGDATAKRIWRTGEDIASYGGPRNALDTVVDNTVNVTHGIAGLPGKALRAVTGGGISPQAMAGAGTGPGGSAPSVGPKPDAAGAGKGTGAAGGGMMDYLTNPYVVGGGLGALGLGGLLYHLNSQPKKKKRDEEEV